MGSLFRKKTNLIVNKTNKNDIIKILGNPSTKVNLIMMFGFILKENKHNQIKNLGK